MSKIRDKITEDLKAAIKAKDGVRISVLRMLKTEIVKFETEEEGNSVDDETSFVRLLKSMKSQREDSIAEFAKAKRMDLVEKETAELQVLLTYLPAQLSEKELDALVDEAIAEADAKDAKAMGQVMKIAMAKAAGKADGKAINALVKSKLSRS